MKSKISLIMVFVLFLGLFSFVFTSFVSAGECDVTRDVTLGSSVSIIFNSNQITCIPSNFALDNPFTTIIAPTCGTVNRDNPQKLTYTPFTCCQPTRGDYFRFYSKASNTYVNVYINILGCPQAVNDSATVCTNSCVNVSVLDNDLNRGTSPVLTVIDQPLSGGGSAQVVGTGLTGKIKYCAPGTPGTYDFNYTFTNGAYTSNKAKVTVTVTKCNSAPTANNDSYSTDEDTPLTITAPGVLSNDTDPESNPLTAIKVSDPSNGSVTLNADGSFTYTPNANFNGSDSFTYKANDGSLDSNIATVTITVNAVNDAPTANNDSYSTDEDTPLTITAPGVLSNDTDPESNPLTAIKVSDPSNGSVTLNADGSFTYTPNANFNGSDSFTYKANDGSLDSNIATVTITVNAVNDAPTANNDSYSTDEDTPLTITAPGVLSNDTDPESNPLTAIKVSDPSNGSVTLNADGSFTYTPNANFNGSDSFTYKANDGSLDSNIATVTITVNAVNDAPTANNDSYSTDEDTPLTITAPGVLSNDTDPESNPLTAIKVSDPSNGSVTLNADGSFTYTPNANFNGSDSFTYKANDGSLDSNIATVTITVNAVNDAPTANNDSYSTDEDTPLTITAPGVLSNDTDPESNPLTAIKVSDPSNGSVTLNADGSFTYTPNANFNGSDSFTYKANDGSLDSNIATVTITVNAVNDAPTANNDSYSTDEDTPLTITAPGVLSNDTDPESNPLTAIKVSDPSNGSVTLNADGSFTYTPNANFNGSDSFTYKANDGSLDSNIATVTITVNAVNDAPTANNDSYSTDEDTPLTITAPGVLSNDTDPESNPLTAIKVSDPSNGSVTLNADGSFTYTPNANFNGSDSFTYKANDGSLDSNIATVTITVNAVNDAPTANNDSYSTDEDTPLTITAPGVLSNDTDPESNPLTAIKVSDPSNGSVTLNADGSFTYTPNANFNGSDSFTYKANDGSLDSNIATVTITVNAGDNDPPVANDDETTTDEDTCVDINVTKNDTDPEDDLLRIVWISEPSFGKVSLKDDNQTITYCPNLNYCGIDTFEYNVSDGQYTDKATVKINILCENDPPVANDDYVKTDLSTCITIDVLQNDYDPEANPLQAILATDPAHGALKFLGDTIGWEYCPDGNFCGIDTFTYVAYDGQYQSNIATVSIEIPCAEIIPPKENVPATLLFPNVGLERLTLTQGPVPLDGSIGAILDTGTNIIVDGKVIAVLEITPGSRSLVAQVDNLGFVTQNDVRLRFEGLPQGVSVTFLPEYQKIKAHNVGTYVVTLNVSENTPKGSYFVKATAFTRSGTLDSEIFNLVIS